MKNHPPVFSLLYHIKYIDYTQRIDNTQYIDYTALCKQELTRFACCRQRGRRDRGSEGRAVGTSLYQKCIEDRRLELLTEWDGEKNAPLTPWTVSYGSTKHVWWRCVNGHEWQARIASRFGGRAGCPVCAGKETLSGETDLATLYPQIAAQWHPEKNGDLTPDKVRPQSNRSVWWRCEEGHEWQAPVYARVHDATGCPYCSNKAILPGFNDLKTLAPELAAQWHPTKNGALTPEMIGVGSKKRVWWQCEKGHAWVAVVASRAKDGRGCPICAGQRVAPGENDLAMLYPQIAAQWHPEKNGDLTPQQVGPQSSRAVWWQCENGHEWRAEIVRRVQAGSGCPYCTGRKVLSGFNDLATLEPKLAEQWHPILNGDLTPEMVTRGSHRKVWWQCKAGHVWHARIDSRSGKSRPGCPVCAGMVKDAERYEEIIQDGLAEKAAHLRRAEVQP